MKTSLALLFAVFMFTAFPAFARKNDPCPAVNSGTESTRKSSHAKLRHSSHVNAGNKAHVVRKKHKGFEKPKNTISKSRKNPNHTKSKFRDGGFYSFRKHSFSGHIFHRH